MERCKAVKATVLAALLAAACAFALAGCAGGPSTGTPVPLEDTTDQMYTEEVLDAELDAVVYQGRAILVPSGYTIEHSFDGGLQEGRFYRIVADVNYLHGGVAGYDGYPEVKSVHSVEEVSPDVLDIPDISQRGSGVMKIGDYAEGDYLLYEYGKMAVLSQGTWVWAYDQSYQRPDGSVACYRDGVDQDAIEAGIGSGVYGCADYFLVPALTKSDASSAA